MKKEDMMHTRGLVIKKEKNGFAQVVMERKGACSLDDPVFEIRQCHRIGKCEGWSSRCYNTNYSS